MISTGRHTVDLTEAFPIGRSLARVELPVQRLVASYWREFRE